MKEANKNSRPLSVVVPAWNCRDHIERLIQEIRNQSYPQNLIEILIIDDGSTDGTGESARALGAKVIRHDQNLGRVAARERGAIEASHDLLVFIDARVSVGPEMLKSAIALNHVPLMGVGVADKYRSFMDRVFYGIRYRVYRPFEPQSNYSDSLWIDQEHFDGRPKGLGLFIVEKKTFLDCRLADQGQDVNDDIKLLKNVVDQGERILRHTDLSFYYQHREDFWDLLRHTFWRGPKFRDYYLSFGGPLFIPYVASWLTLIGSLVSVVFFPVLSWAYIALLLFILVLAPIFFCEKISDYPYMLFGLPILGGAFGFGVLWAQWAKWFGLRKLMLRH